MPRKRPFCPMLLYRGRVTFIFNLIVLLCVRRASTGIARFARDTVMEKEPATPAPISGDMHHQLSHLAAIVASSDDAIVGKDLRSMVTSWNRGAEQIFGYSAAEMVGQSILRLIPGERHAEEEHILSEVKSGRRVDHFETVRVTKDGRQIHVSVTCSPIRSADGAIVGISKVARDITDRKRAADERIASEARYRTLFEYAPAGIVIANAKGVYLDANAQLCQMLGYTREELIGKSGVDIVVPSEVAYIQPALDAIGSGGSYTREWLFRRKDGSTLSTEVIATLMPDGNLLGIIRDISERQRLESQLRQAQKMEAVGQFAAGVAHDFNNQITVVVGFAQLIKEMLPPQDPTQKMLEEVFNAGQRSASLTQQLLAFSRKQVLAPKVIDLNEIILNTEKMLRRMIGEDVELVFSPRAGLEQVLADPGQIEQVLFNLAVNARDAMPQGGKLTIETNNVELDEHYCRTHAGALPGQYVMLAVTDSGMGMMAEIKKRIFEPFFTTKEVGKGTGLGLAVVHGIIKQSGGNIEVYSEPNVGTCFKIYFPRVQPQRSAGAGVVKEAAPVTGHETIMLVEDEDALRMLSKQVLQQRGYKVLDAAHPDIAIELATDYKPRIDLLITDVVMPGQGGRVLAEKLLLIHPEMKVLYMSGYTDDAVVRHGILHESVNFLRKPFTPATFSQKVREVLGHAKG